MRKKDFLAELARGLENIPARDRDDILDYYDELIEDKIDRTGKYEEEVIRELGPIDGIIKRVNPTINTNDGSSDKIRYDEYREEKNTKMTIERENSKDYERDTKENTTTDKAKRDSIKRKNHNDRVLVGVIIGVVTFPIWFSLLMAAIGIIIGIVAAGIGSGVAGVALIVHGLIALAASTTRAAFEIGIGLALSGVACIFSPLIFKFLVFIVKQIGKLLNWMFNGFRGGSVCEN